MQNTFYFILKWALPALPLALLCGCNECQTRSRLETVEARLEAPPQKPKESVPPPVSGVPIRRTLAGLGSASQELARIQLQLQALPMVYLAAKKLGDGRIELSGVFASSGKAEDWLTTHGFSKTDSGGWARALDAAQLPVLKREVESKLRENNTVWAAQSGLRNDGPAKLVYTGELLDAAMARASMYMEAQQPGSGKTVLLRSGRFFVAENGELRIRSAVSGNERAYLPVGIDKPVPQNADRLSIDAEGRVNAFDVLGAQTELGQLKIISASGAVPAEDAGAYRADENSAVATVESKGIVLLRMGHLETREPMPDLQALRDSVVLNRLWHALEQGIAAAENLSTAPQKSRDVLPLIVHAALPKATEHLKALNISVEKNNERITIGGNAADEQAVTDALVKVMSGLRRRMEVHEENLRNAGKTRDADGRLNAYRRKTVQVGDNGALIEGVDNSPLPKTYKAGDPDAGADGFVVMPNVNKAVETAEFRAAIEEFKLLRIALERLAPGHIFPEPPPAP